ncbi:PREDICTED: DNA-binding protein inhibitor ID-4 [Nipponia nippon]|nr:PREDICTED: DNA-binding protein inhibitor ID-4 [Nipponia nippon]
MRMHTVLVASSTILTDPRISLRSLCGGSSPTEKEVCGISRKAQPGVAGGGGGHPALRCLAEHSGCKGGPPSGEEPAALCLQCDMNDCYSRLRKLVPTIPPNKRVSKVEILQHVIDYILDLQLALETHPALLRQQQQPPAPHPGSWPAGPPTDPLYVRGGKTICNQRLAALTQLRTCKKSHKKHLPVHQGGNSAGGLWYPGCPPPPSEGHGRGKQSTLLAAYFKVEDMAVAGTN